MHRIKLTLFAAFMLFISNSFASVGFGNKEFVLYVMPVKVKDFVNLAPSAMDQFADFLDDYFNHNTWEFAEITHSITTKRKKRIFKISTTDFGEKLQAYTLEVKPKKKRLQLKLTATTAFIKALREEAQRDGSYSSLKNLRKDVEEQAVKHLEDIKGYWW